MIIFYQLFTFVLLLFLILTPRQLDSGIVVGIVVYAVFCLPLLFKKFKTLRKLHLLFILWILFLLSALCATIFSISLSRSLPVFLLFCSYAVVFATSGLIFSTEKSKKIFAAGFIFITLIASVISLYNTLILHIVNYQSEGASFLWTYFGHNYLSNLLFFAIPISFFFTRQKNKRIAVLTYVALYVFLVAFFFSFARIATFSLFTSAIGGWIVFQKQDTGKGFWRFSLPLILFSLAVLSWCVPFFLGSAFHMQKSQIDYRDRIFYAQLAVDRFTAHPVVGTGLDTFQLRSVSGAEHFTRTQYVYTFFLQMLSDAGIFGFITSLCLILAVLWHATKKVFAKTGEQRLFLVCLWIGLVASTINSLGDFDWQLPTVFLAFWIVVGLFDSSQKTLPFPQKIL